MGFSVSTKILRRIKTAAPPIIEHDPEKQNHLLATWAEALTPISTIHVEYPSRYSHTPRKKELKVTVGKSRGEYGYGYGYEHGTLSLEVYFKEKEHVLVARVHYYDPVPLASLEQLTLLIQLVEDKLRMDKEHAAKIQKIKNLKTQSVESSVRLLAKDLKFDYSLDKMQTKLKLTVRMDDMTGLMVDIPYGRFQEVLTGLRTLIQTLLDLHNQGIRFKVGGALHVRRWTPYEKGGGSSSQALEPDEDEEDEEDEEAEEE